MSWELQKEKAGISVNDWHIELNPTDPSAGLSVRNGNRLLGKLLCVVPQPSHSRHIQEAYVRQNDLIVRYEQHGNDLYTFQLNWRSFNCDLPDSVGIELWISVQTSLLDTYPTVDVKSTSFVGTWLSHSLRDLEVGESDLPGVFVAGDRSTSALIMIEASDVEQTEPQTTESGDDNALRMFGHFMEKGVIRRGRLCLVLANSKISTSEIKQAYEQFLASPLPLTA